MVATIEGHPIVQPLRPTTSAMATSAMATAAIASAATAMAVLFITSGAHAQTPPPATPPNPALQAAIDRYPPLIMGPGLRGTDGTGAVPTLCTPPGGVVEVKGGPAFIYRGADPKEPELCNLSVGGQDAQAWFGIWVTAWPGAAEGREALRRVIGGKTGETVGFDVVMGPEFAYHDVVRNEGIEELSLLGYVYTTLKLSHYREGFNGNNYRSVSTVWKDFATGMVLYTNYQHIAGSPVLDGAFEPTVITLPP